MITRPTIIAVPQRPSSSREGRVADPFAALQRQVGRLIEDYRAPDTFGSGRLGATDITEDASGYHIYIEVPGCSEKDIGLSTTNGILTISGEKKSPIADTEQKQHVAGRMFGAFEEHFNLPEEVNPEGIVASIKNGVLQITLPRREPVKPAERKIEIKAG
ncbi:Hsp20/alpha crystallin family protein [Gluconacetobacter entanii]|uniref:Heat-shock protein Hsp20 n=1 Tax=Gluconacetobacter entanii TaxID=108528 RepID=A0A318PR38_9PROT|nr:Hsp20/alpha crystallin family protein [Gluconacetobacter entanii]MBE7619477.1 Hsp20 family protein [Komagataeibacter sp. FXV2]MCE2577825.1 Hsp20/alpha crystallin family protein [Komagataeibacter sp. FNDCR1]MBY4640057.1 Hsp20/alpha crystallin family protein [Gluconacetobacter entanii]MCW4581413.1 Hsp20/alpha crystallin family protein [Gluconacetobacter entanii]MCW4584747.1 Hsp20/alpha crystallin family protein [Gluconacetobacter entanii]